LLAQGWMIAAALLSFIGYFGTSHIPGLAVHPVPSTWIDRAIPLLPATAYGYVSLYPLLLGNLVYLVPRPQALLPLLRAFILANVLSGIWFVCYRTTAERPPLPQEPGAGLLGLLWSIDPPYNALPSLHTLYSVLIGVAHMRWRSPYRWMIAAWAAVVIASTLTTKQHQLVDVIAGIIFAGLIARWLLANLRPEQLGPVADYQ
jgi:membrane-associated phospholipid phosphatase